MAKARDVHFDPTRAVWDSLHKAEVFIQKARGSDLPLEWCIEVTCNGLWAALMIFNKHLLNRGRKSAAITTDWFKENGNIVWKIRNAVEHYDFSWGIGQSFTPRHGGPGVTVDADGIAWHAGGSREGEGDTVRTYVWITQALSAQEIPIDEALNELEAIRQTIEELVWHKTGSKYLKFYTAPG